MEKNINGKDLINLTISETRMQAFVSLIMPWNQDTECNIGELVHQFLKEKGIVYGIDEQAIQKFTSEMSYGEKYEVAKGKEGTDGVDGYYEFLFDTSVQKTPLVLEDGSVDYTAMTRVVTVAQEDQIALYHKAVPGVPGIDVYGHEVKKYNGKEKMPLKGKGFTVNEDKTIYTASITGRIELNNDQIIISNVLEIKENIDCLQGNIHFKGDLVIRGDVVSNMVVEADGSIMISGNVEGATIIAGKDVILEKGMQGAEKGTIICKGNVRGKFFEYATIQAGEGVYSNSILGCNVEAGTEIVVDGKRGSIIGGKVFAIERVKATNIGTEKELRTIISVGVSEDEEEEIRKINEMLNAYQQKVSQIESAIAMIEEKFNKSQVNPFEQQRLQLIRTKIDADAKISELLAKRFALYDKIVRSKKAECLVEQNLYGGTLMVLQGISMVMKQSYYRVRVVKRDYELIIESK